MTAEDLTEQLRARIAARLDAFAPRTADGAGLRHAAVAVTVVGDEDGTACFLITKRTPRMRSHTGQWALPGGRVDPGEDAVTAARRELHEELALDLPAEAAIGRLDDYVTRSGYRITPVVLWGGAAPVLEPNPQEVAFARVVPLADLEVEPRFLAIPESDRPVIQLPILDTLIHAPTGAVLYQFREVVLHGRDTRVDGIEQPVWAWR